MPFSHNGEVSEEQWTEIYTDVFKPAIENANLGYICERSEVRNGAFIRDIISNLKEARVVLADITGYNPNVMWELGVRHALSRRTIIVSWKGKNQKKIISNMSTYGVLEYNPSSPKDLNEFKRRIGKILDDMEKDPDRSDNPVFDFLVDHEPIGKEDVLSESKISNIDIGQYYIVEAIVLSEPTISTITLKDGKTIVAETLLGDDTGEIRLIGYGRRSKIIQKLKVGDRVRINGVSAQSTINGLDLIMGPYSTLDTL